MFILHKIIFMYIKILYIIRIIKIKLFRMNTKHVFYMYYNNNVMFIIINYRLMNINRVYSTFVIHIIYIYFIKNKNFIFKFFKNKDCTRIIYN